MPDRVGQQLGNYQLLRLLGEGGQASVYLGRHIHLGTQAAVKVLQTQLVRSDIEQFRQEARTIAHLEHPHIVRVLDFGVQGTTPFLVMSYARGGTLRTRHPKGTRLSLATVIPYVSQVASALQYAHDRNLIHRDVKPENVLVSSSNDLLLSDFGIALIAQSSRYQSRRDMAGTIAYMAPEQIAGHPRTASDQYALGIIIYEWLCGTRPFQGTFAEIAAQHSVTPPPSPRRHLPTLSPEIEQVIMTALVKRPEGRFTSVSAMALALQQASQSRFPTEHAHSTPFSSGFPPKTTRVLPSVKAAPLAKPLYQPTGPASHTSAVLPRVESPPKEKVNEPVRALQRKRGAKPRVALLALVGLAIIALASGLIWSLSSHGASSSSVVHAGNVTEFPVSTPASSPYGITAGPDGNLWFTEFDGNKIGRISPSGIITEFPALVSGGNPYGITAGPDGNLWFTEDTGNKIGRITTSGTITEFPVLTSASQPEGIAAGPDGNLWFTEYSGNLIGRITTYGTITEFPALVSGGNPYGITTGSDRNLWFTEYSGNKIGRITTNGTITEFPVLTPDSLPNGITAGPDGNLWFTEFGGNKIGRISPSGIITEFPVPTPASEPQWIATGPDGNLWFTELGGNKIGRISPSGTITEFPVSTPASSPYGITAGPDNNLWFTEDNGDKIGRMDIKKYASEVWGNYVQTVAIR